jgi:prepilin-type N-terminal cleavage/methylation domain-containing protein
MKTLKNIKGFSLIEMIIVIAIILFLTLGLRPVLLNFKSRRFVSQGIYRVFMLKKAVDSMAAECGGYPYRDFGGPISDLKRIADRCPSGSCPPYPNGLPRIFPDVDHQCDIVSIKESIPGNFDFGSVNGSACDADNVDCRRTISSGSNDNYNSLFVQDTGAGGGIADQCSVKSGAYISGWNYVLVINQADPTRRPVPVVCANVQYRDDSVTVVVNGGGIATNSPLPNDAVPDGSGMIAPNGSLLTTYCPCGAWCSDNHKGITGCCDKCVDSNGTKHYPGEDSKNKGFKY